MQQPVLLPYSSSTFTQNALLVGAEVDLEVALLRCPVVTVGALKGLFPSVCSHVKRQNTIETKALATQRAWVLSVFMTVVRWGADMYWDVWVGPS